MYKLWRQTEGMPEVIATFDTPEEARAALRREYNEAKTRTWVTPIRHCCFYTGDGFRIFAGQVVPRLASTD